MDKATEIHRREVKRSRVESLFHRLIQVFQCEISESILALESPTPAPEMALRRLRRLQDRLNRIGQ